MKIARYASLQLMLYVAFAAASGIRDIGSVLHTLFPLSYTSTATVNKINRTWMISARYNMDPIDFVCPSIARSIRNDNITFYCRFVIGLYAYSALPLFVL